MMQPVRVLQVPPPWQALLFPVAKFPWTPADRGYFAPRFSRLADELTGKLQTGVFLQVWKLNLGAGSEVLNEHVQAWWPVNGIGIWPDREGPSLWTADKASDVAASLYDHSEPELPHHRVLRLSAEGAVGLQAADEMRGFGALIQTFTPLKPDETTQRGREQFLPNIEEPFFRNAKFYAPLLNAATLAGAHSATVIEGWMCGAEVYLRESAEDGGVLVLSSTDLTGPLTRAGFELPWVQDAGTQVARNGQPARPVRSL